MVIAKSNEEEKRTALNLLNDLEWQWQLETIEFFSRKSWDRFLASRCSDPWYYQIKYIKGRKAHMILNDGSIRNFNSQNLTYFVNNIKQMVVYCYRVSISFLVLQLGWIANAQPHAVKRNMSWENTTKLDEPIDPPNSKKQNGNNIQHHIKVVLISSEIIERMIILQRKAQQHDNSNVVIHWSLLSWGLQWWIRVLFFQGLRDDIWICNPVLIKFYHWNFTFCIDFQKPTHEM